MNLQNRIARLEAAMSSDGECPECSGQLIRAILSYCPHFGDPEPEIPVCAACGQPRGDVMVLQHVVIDRNAAGELVELDGDGE